MPRRRGGQHAAGELDHCVAVGVDRDVEGVSYAAQDDRGRAQRHARRQSGEHEQEPPWDLGRRGGVGHRKRPENVPSWLRVKPVLRVLVLVVTSVATSIALVAEAVEPLSSVSTTFGVYRPLTA